MGPAKAMGRKSSKGQGEEAGEGSLLLGSEEKAPEVVVDEHPSGDEVLDAEATISCCQSFTLNLYDANWPRLFTRSTCCNGTGLICWRVFLLVAVLFLDIWSIYEWCVEGVDDDSDGDGKYGDGIEFQFWFIKLTHWGLLLQTVYFTMSLICTFKGLGVRHLATIKPVPSDEPTPLLPKATWCLQSICLPTSFLIVALYWSLVYKGNLFAVSVGTHGVNFILQYADHLTSHLPMRLAHMIYPMIFATTFALFSLVYYEAGGTFEDGKLPYIYSAIDWRNPIDTAALSCGLVFMVVPVVWLLFWGPYRCRQAC